VRKLIFISVLAIFLSSCVSTRSFGPGVLRDTHSGYNQAMVKSLDEQMLLNLVRLRYRDSVYFLQVGSVTASFTLSSGIGVEAGLDFATDGNVINPNASINYSQTPTISYQPLQGEDFLKSVLSPISIETLLAMSQSGWSLERIFAIAVERINDIVNAPSASGPTPLKPPYYSEFSEFIVLLYELKKERSLEFGTNSQGKPIIKFKTNSEKEAVISRIKEIAKISQEKNELELNRNFLDRKEDSLTVRSRSILGVMFNLSQNIEIPQEHKDRGLVTVTTVRGDDTTEFDWAKPPAGEKFFIRSSKNPPSNYFIRVHYRDHWFYLADDDLQSKSSFMFLNQLFSLQAGQIEYTRPTLTIPIGNN
jgi:hypothetical protein